MVKNARRHDGIAIVRVPRYAPERDSGLSGPADCGRISVFGLLGGRMKRFFRRAGCAPPDDSRRRGVVLCHSVDGHMPSTTTRRGRWLCVCVADGPRGMELRECRRPKGRQERGAGNPNGDPETYASAYLALLGNDQLSAKGRYARGVACSFTWRVFHSVFWQVLGSNLAEHRF